MTSPSVKGYNRLADVYEGLERLAFGNRLMKARLTFVSAISDSQNILILGEGDGRFLKNLLAHLPTAQFTCIEQSPKMIQKARTRLIKDELGRVTFINTDIWNFTPDARAFDSVISTFFLDMFDEFELNPIIEKFGASLKQGGFWYYADFYVSEKASLGRIHSQIWLTVLYHFFAWQTGLKLRRLVHPHAYFEMNKFKLIKKRDSSLKLFTSCLYQK